MLDDVRTSGSGRDAYASGGSCGSEWRAIAAQTAQAEDAAALEVSAAHDALMIEGAHDELADAEASIAAGAVSNALRSIADAVTALDEIGRKDPDRGGSPLMLGSRLVRVLREIGRLRDAELDALIAEP
jgi:hypothetical protein